MLSSSPAVLKGSNRPQAGWVLTALAFTTLLYLLLWGWEVHMPAWRSEDSFMESIAFFYLYMTFGD